MGKAKRVILAIAGVALMSSCALIDGSEKNEIKLINSGQAKYVIIADNDKAEKKAAVQLQKCMEKITGAKLRIEKPDYKGKLKRIYISNGKVADDFNINLKEIKSQGFAIQTKNGNLALVGKDSDGTEFAVNFFLQKYCGIRWFFPGELGTIIPKKKTLAIPELSEIQNPDFVLREVGGKNFKKWREHNLLGNAFPYYGGHSFYKHVPPEKYWKTHPEYYAMINGKRKKPEYLDNPKLRKWGGWQLCTSNPEVVEKVAESVCKIFEKRPALKAVGICPNDGGGFCECEACKALDREEGSITDRIYTFANAVAEKVAKKYPDKYVLMFAYSSYIKPPLKLKKLHPNIIVWYAYATCMRSCPENDIKLEELATWGKLAKHIWIYEYYIVEGWKQHFPPYMIDILSWQIPYLHKNNVDGYITQSGQDWGMNGPHYYLAAQLLWDSSRNPKKIMDEYYSLLFEKAAPAMKKYFKAMEHAWNNNIKLPQKLGKINDLMFMQIYPENFLEECRGYFAEAEIQEKDNEKVLKRIKMFRTGFKFLENHIAILKSLQKLAEAGIPVGYDFMLGEAALSPDEIKKRLEDSAQKVKEQLDFCEANKKTDLIGYDWLRNPGTNEGRYIPRYQKKFKLIEQYLNSYSAEKEAQKLPALWDFRLDKKDEGISKKWFAQEWPSSDTAKIRVPSFWNKTKRYENYGGVAWYRTSFDIPCISGNVTVRFGAVDAEADVYVNGKFAGKHAYKTGSWKEPFEFNIAKYVKEGENILTVRVDGHERNCGIWQPVDIFLSNNDKNLIVNGKFNNGLKGWSFSPYRDKKGEVCKPKISKPGRNADGPCVMRSYPGQVNQKVAVVPGKKYKFSGWVKTQDMDKKSYADLYIAKGVCRAGALKGNSDWKYFEGIFTAKLPLAIITLRLTGKGKACFDDIELIEMKDEK